MANPEVGIDVALRVDPVVWAGFDVDRSFHAHTYATTPDAAPPPELVKVLGEPSFAVSPPFSEATAADAALSSIDLRVLAVLMRQPRAPLKEIAAATGLSAKTARRHREPIFANGSFMLIPVIHAAQARGLVLYNAYAQDAAVPSKAQRILSALPPCRLITTRTNPPGVWLLGWATSMAGFA